MSEDKKYLIWVDENLYKDQSHKVLEYLLVEHLKLYLNLYLNLMNKRF